MRTSLVALPAVLALSIGCTPPDAITEPPTLPRVPGPDGRPVIDNPFIDPRVADTPVSLGDPPPPISGGTLEVLGSGAVAVVADPDRDRVVIVDLVATGGEPARIDLPDHAQPTRVIEGASGRVHVVLRGTGEILSFLPFAPEAAVRRFACPMPRGVAERGDDLVVACRGGELVTMPEAGGGVMQTVIVERDLRDVIVQDGRVFVSTFRAAELLEVDPATGAILGERRPFEANLGGGFVDERGEFVESAFVPGVAWRTISAPASDGGEDVAMVHQRSSDAEVQPDPGGYGGGGGRGGCGGGIIASTITFFHADGTVSHGPDLMGAPLPVDMAITAPVAGEDQLVVVVAAANESGEQSIQTYARSGVDGPEGTEFGCAFNIAGIDSVDGSVRIENPTSVEIIASGPYQRSLLVLQRDPGRLVMLERIGDPSLGVTWRRARSWTIGTESAFDTGHAVFHANSSAGLACASCHPEGGDDARTWRFGGIGPRRTPAMHGDLIGTEPFHWDGDMADLNHLVHDVFTGRMSGPELRRTDVNALGAWLDELPRPAPSIHDADAAARGREVFERDGGCVACHSGGLMTNNASVDVGTGGTFQVPSLIGVADRLPVMHDGCAHTLRERFLPECGGPNHGSVDRLTDPQIDDLVAYLETL